MLQQHNLGERLKARSKNLILLIAELTNTIQYIPIFIHKLHRNPSSKLKLIGVTGTNGKTTTTYLIYQALQNLGENSGLIGTVQVLIGDHSYQTNLTTPKPYQLNQYLSEMIQAQCNYCVMEVSSIGIEEHRINGLKFSAAVYTNLTHDHLNYHKTFENYRRSKSKLFSSLDHDSIAIANLDDIHCNSVLNNTKAKVITFGKLESKAPHIEPDISFQVIKNDLTGLLLEIENQKTKFNLIGEFNAYNIMAAYTTLSTLGFRKNKILEALSNTFPPPGRLKILNPEDYGKYPMIIVDYAHTPDAMEKLLETVRTVININMKITILFGCGGGRDKFKRPKMGSIAEKLADYTIITSANSRNESTEQICSDIKSGFTKSDSFSIVLDRKKAIRQAILESDEKSVIVIAGLGHKKYQEIKGIKHYHSDEECAKKVLSEISD